MVAADALDAAVAAQVALLCRAAPQAAATAKALVRQVAGGTGTAAGLDRANAELIARLRVSPEGQGRALPPSSANVRPPGTGRVTTCWTT